jgi:nucleoside-diphosphate-sugar epimerase
MVNLFTGSERGFLGSNLKNEINGVNIDYGDILKDRNIETKIDNIFHFAGPSDDFDFANEEKTIKTIINGTINLLNLARNKNAKFIFASTKGVKNPNNVYCYSKLLMEEYIKNNYDNYIILRIPRVYDKKRNKGLMKKLKLNLIPKEDMNKKIEYINLENFIKQTLIVVNQKNIVYNYNNLECNSIHYINENFNNR